jgi:hypothetical protein
MASVRRYTASRMDEKPPTKADLDAAVSTLQEGLTEAIHDAQTELLRGFEVYAKAVEARLRRLELGSMTQGAYETALNERMLTLEGRLVEIEKKLLDKGRNGK